MIESQQTAEGVVAALWACTLDVRAEEWRQRLAATGLGSGDVRLVVRAVESARVVHRTLSSSAFGAIIAVPLCVGILVVLFGGVCGNSREAKTTGFVCGGIFLAMAAVVICWGVAQHRWAKKLQAGVEPILVTALFPAAGSVQGIQKSRIVCLKDRF